MSVISYYSNPSGEEWWAYPVTNGVTYVMRWYNPRNAAILCRVWHGDCEDLHLVHDFTHTGQQEYPSVADDNLFFRVTSSPGVTAPFLLTIDP